MDEQLDMLAGIIDSCTNPTELGNFGESRLLIRPVEEWQGSIAVRDLVRLVLPKGGNVWARVKGFELSRTTTDGKPRAILIEWPEELGTWLPPGTQVYARKWEPKTNVSPDSP